MSKLLAKANSAKGHNDEDIIIIVHWAHSLWLLGG